MDKNYFGIKSNTALAGGVYKMRLLGDTSAITAPGQFVNVAIDGEFLRRPISVCDADEFELTLIYKVVGKGTKKLSELKSGQGLDILTGLGNGYDTSISGNKPLLIGGGVGVPPMYLLAKKLLEQGKSVSVIMGFGSKNEVFYEDEFRALGCRVYVTTVDGSYGIKGFVTDAFAAVQKDIADETAPFGYTAFYACGPLPMLKAVYDTAKTSGQMSFEQRMGCGFGACMGCSMKTVSGYKRICKDGPVLTKEEILWED